MKVCATFGSEKDYAFNKNLKEIRMDVFKKIPKVDKNTIIALCGKTVDSIPIEFDGIVDVGFRDVKTKQKKIVSYHDFKRTPSPETMEKIMKKYECDISKGAFLTRDFRDLHSIFLASQKIKGKHILVGMGETGTVTRIRSDLLKNEFTYGYIGKPTAEGQLEYDVTKKLDKCKIVGLVGKNISHSLSPSMQNAAISKAKINAVYLKFDVENITNLKETMTEYKILGFNITSPFKEKAISATDSLSAESKEIAAVNTIKNTNGKLKGYDTDVKGFEYALKKYDPSGKKAIVMGTGGAAKAAVCALNRFGCDVAICGRNSAKTRKISKMLGCEILTCSTVGCEILINCTPIGLTEGKYPAEIKLKKEHIIFDAIYGKETPLLKKAKKAGCITCDGKELLLGQGAESFRIWFGKYPDENTMRRSIG